MKKEIEKLKRR